ncbi:TLD-domain-containing protein [Desarmillaria ectypa]|nr:TLD-domain-containing protein [Desarmillaria ectypa]
MDSIHPLVPSRDRRDSEEMIDKFATLFSPPTPRATPTNTPPPTISPLDSPRSPDGEFGAFVFVPPSQDPLAIVPFSPVDTKPDPSTNHTFFDEAKRAQERNKRDLLDELLLDEPLFRHKELPTPTEVDTTSDWDDDFLSAKTSSLSASLVSIAPSSRHSYSPPSRASTLSRVTPAPPIASTSSVSLPINHSNTLPSRWILPPRQPPSPSARATLDSLFDHHVDPPRPHSVVPVEISHDTPFAPHASASETSSVVYIPPTGAPGYRGEGYNWDKGFSNDLETELANKENRHERAPSAPLPNMADSIEKKMGDVDLKGRRETTVGVLDTALANMIRPRLPALSRLPRTWTLLYSLDQHGISLNTLYSRSEQTKPFGALIVVKDDGDTIFGAFIGDGIRQSRGRGYYGTGESFLWRYSNSKLSVYKTTGKNNYIALCEPDYLSFGGGDGSYGLYIDESLLDGSSARCLTFGNEVLCSPGKMRAGGAVPFDCVGLEVWRLG